MIPDRTRFEHAAPILCVKDMSASLSYYVDLLGFKNADWGKEAFTHVQRDTAGIYLCQSGEYAQTAPHSKYIVTRSGVIYDHRVGLAGYRHHH